MNEYSNDDFSLSQNSDNSTGQGAYDSYYKHKPTKSRWPIVIAIFIVAIIAFLVLWSTGVFKPIDVQVEQNSLNKKICTAAVKYANDKYANQIDLIGKTLYVNINMLAEENLIESEIFNYTTNETIPGTTPVQLKVFPNNNFQCNGLLYPSSDKTKPVITLIGESTITSSVGVAVTDPGYAAEDNEDGDITDNVERNGNVDITKAGTYIIKYVVSDQSGNISDTKTRTYIIK